MRKRHPDVRDAFTAVVDAAYPRLLGYCRALIGPVLAEEATQEAILRAWRYLHTYRGEVALQGWLIRICRNTAYDIAAREQRRLDTATDPLPEPTHGHALIPHADIELEVLVHDHLPLAEREAFVLTQMFDLSYSEAADILGIPTGTIRSRIARARRRLAHQIDLAVAS